MFTRFTASSVPGLVILGVLAGCATGTLSGSKVGSTSAAGHRTPSHYAQSTDSATSGCLRNPACYGQSGDDAIIPWLSRAARAARTTATLATMLADTEVQVVEQVLTQCAKAAHQQVNAGDKELQGQEPTREQCKEVLRKEGDKEITRAMELGARKHKLALDCARAAFAERFSENVTVEPTYQQDTATGRWMRLDPKKVAEWLELGLTGKLWGSLVPDIVIHAAGDPNQVRHVYDFKFPCPANNEPSWRKSTKGQPHHPNDQRAMYRKALLGGKSEPRLVTPEGVK
ncbi:hypothetical protein [Archangium lipolyticum]|uniref:hypothetical protein n=1 Tax=Archangium lipolyticum TaxID=2970465 RepID=UPI00214A82BE|nr:hypothetical protein [Archangium lipolyticum]